MSIGIRGAQHASLSRYSRVSAQKQHPIDDKLVESRRYGSSGWVFDEGAAGMSVQVPTRLARWRARVSQSFEAVKRSAAL